MKFIFFGREFYFFANEAQFNKFIGLVAGYALNPAVISAVVAVIFYGALLKYYKKKKMPYHYRSFKKLQFFIVLFVVFAFTLLNRTEHVRQVIILIPDITAGSTYYHESMILFFAINVVMYTPYGYYTAVFFGKPLKYKNVYLTDILTCLFIEVTQYIFAEGYSTAAEVIAAFVGASIGMLFYSYKYKLLKEKTLRRALNENREKLYD